MLRLSLSLALAATVFASSACNRSLAPEVRARSALLVTIDTLRADRVGAYGDARARTPTLDRLAQQGTRFQHAFTPVPITLPAHVSLMTGLLPPAHGVRGNGFALAPGPPTLAEAAAGRGLATAAFVGGFPLSRRFGLARGFSHYDDALGRAPGVHFEFAERRAYAVAAAAEAWLDSHSGPVFVWVHFFDPHAPYDPPAEFASNDPYRGEIAAADAALSRLLSKWSRRPEASVVAVASDHGEAFGEHGEESHSLFLYDTTLHVPLVFQGAGVPAGRRIPTSVGLEDVAATLLARLEGTGPSLPGRDLLQQPLTEKPLYAETLAPRLDFGWSELRSWRTGPLKYVRAPRPELFEWASDPGEEKDLGEARPSELARMERELASRLGTLQEHQGRRTTDPEAAERLRSLGYAQGPQVESGGADPKDKLAVARRIARATGPFPDQQTAAATYAEIAKLDPDNPLVNLRLGNALLKSGRAAEAEAALRRVTARHPRSAEPFVGLAAACAALQKWGEAEQALQQALQREPDNAQAHFNLGELALARGDRGQAAVHFRAAIDDPVTSERARARLEQLR